MFKQTLAVFIAVSGSSGLAMAQTTEPAAPQPKCAAPALADMVDLDPVMGSNLMTVPVAINGSSRKFLLHVGRTPDEVSDATASDLHLPQAARITDSGGLTGLNTPYDFRATMVDVRGANAGAANQKHVRATDFTIGTATVHDVTFLVANDRDLGTSKPYDGLLTTGMFSAYDINLDFGGRKFSFITATSCADPNQVAYWPHEVVATIPITVEDGKITVPVTVQGRQIDAVIDTGSEHTVMRRAVAEQMFGLKAGTPEMTQDGDARDGSGERIYQHTFAQIAFGGVIANNVPARIQANSMVRKKDKEPTLGSRAQFTSTPSERLPDLALGMDVLRRLHLYVAFGQSKLYVTPAQ